MIAGEAQDTSLPDKGPGSRTRRRAFLGTSGLLALAILVVFRDVLLPFVLALVLAYVLSPLVSTGERLRIAGRSPPRWLVVLTLYTALIGLLVALVSATIPRLAAEIGRLAREAPAAVQTLRDEWIPDLERRLRLATASYLEASDSEESEPAGADEAEPGGPAAAPGSEPEAEAEEKLTPWQARHRDATDPTAIRIVPRGNGGFNVILPDNGVRVLEDDKGGYRIETRPNPPRDELDITAAITESLAGNLENTEKVALTVLAGAQKLVGALTRGLFGFVMTLMLSAFMLITSDRIFAFFRSLYRPSKRHHFDELVTRLDRGLAGVVRGQLIICVVNGGLTGIGLWAMGIKYWTFLTLLATVMSLVPIFGSILSTIPAVAVALPDGWSLALGVLVYIILIHQLEANFFNPKIMGDAAKVHPVLIVFALLAGEHVAGITGALLAVPVLSITQTLFLFLREQSLGVPRSPPNAASDDLPAGEPQAARIRREASSS